MGPRTLTEEELDELREALAAWRTVRRVIATGFVVLIGQTASLIAWGVSVEQRIAAAQQIDRTRDGEIALLRKTLDEINAKLDRVQELIYRNSALNR